MKAVFSVAKASGNTVDTVSTPVEAIQRRTYTDAEYMQKICWVSEKSPLCNNYDLYNVLKAIANKYNVPVWLMLWIMHKESKLWTSYHHTNTADCRENTNNRHGSKANHTSEWAKRTTTVWPWCRLQKYDTIEEGFISLARTLWIGYKTCIESDNPTVCISYRYVGDANVSEPTRVYTVWLWY